MGRRVGFSAAACAACLLILLNIATADLGADEQVSTDRAPSADALVAAAEPTAEVNLAAVETPAPGAAGVLGRLDEPSRNNAMIQLKRIGSADSSLSVPDAEEIEALWNIGLHLQALETLRQLEWNGLRFSVAISWRNPIVSDQKNRYLDVRIGSPRTGGARIHLDFHRRTGNLFAMVKWLDGWTMNISTDGGASWQETFAYLGGRDASMAVGGDYAWVGYVDTGDSSIVRMLRFDVTTGFLDPAYDEMVADINPEWVREIAVASNADDVDAGIYLGFIGSDLGVRMYWDDLAGTSFAAFHPPVTDAIGGLDFTTNPHGFGASGYTWFFSYFTPDVGAGESIKVWRAGPFSPWEEVLSIQWPTATSVIDTAISAYHDTVMVVRGYPVAGEISYRVSYDAGGTWSTGNIYTPLAGEPSGRRTDISLRSGLGSAAIFHREDGAFDGVYLSTRLGYSPGPFSDPIAFNEVDGGSATMPTIEWLGARCVCSHGLGYLDGSNNIPYFDLATERGLFCDGFEAGDTTGWSSSSLR